MVKEFEGQEYTAAQLDEVREIMEKRLDANKAAVKEKAKDMADEENYVELMTFCYDRTEAWLTKPENLQKVFTNPNSIEEAYQTITTDEKFETLASEDYRLLPRILTMTVLAGSMAAACHEALENLQDLSEEQREDLDRLANLYHKYMEDAVSYGKGENKTISFPQQEQ